MQKVEIGQLLAEFPGRTFNEIIDWIDKLRRGGDVPPPPQLPASGSSTGVIAVHNTTSQDLAPYSILGCNAPLNQPSSATDNGVQYRNPILAGATPDATDHARKFVVLQQSVPKDNVGYGLKLGFTFVKVDVIDAAHEFAAVKDGDTTQLTSATSGAAEIYWKESGTGTKWALVLLGAGASAGTVKARVTTTISAAAGPLTADWGAGEVKLQDPTTGALAADATEVQNDNIGTSWAVDCQVTLDTSYSPPRVIGGSCGAVTWGD